MPNCPRRAPFKLPSIPQAMNHPATGDGLRQAAHAAHYISQLKFSGMTPLGALVDLHLPSMSCGHSIPQLKFS